jgi:hypothetical protein
MAVNIGRGVGKETVLALPKLHQGTVRGKRPLGAYHSPKGFQ